MVERVRAEGIGGREVGVALHEIDLLLPEAATKEFALQDRCATISATKVEPDERAQNKERNDGTDDHRSDGPTIGRARWISRGSRGGGPRTRLIRFCGSRGTGH